MYNEFTPERLTELVTIDDPLEREFYENECVSCRQQSL